jgi:hypothetical protein
MLRLKWLFFGIVGVLAAAGAFWIWNAVRGPDAAGRRLSDALEEGLQARPTVYVSRRVVVEEKRPIAELALVSRETAVEHRMEREFLRSRAELALRAVYTVKAGFDLRSPRFAAHLDADRKRAELHLPRPRVLSLHMAHYEVLEDRSGWWSKVSETDRELALRQMQADAKLEAIRAGILEDCKKELEGHLKQVPERTGLALEFRYLPEDPDPALKETGAESEKGR